MGCSPPWIPAGTSTLARSSRSNRLVIILVGKIIKELPTCDHLERDFDPEALTSPCLRDIVLCRASPMINTHRRWSLPVILGSMVLLLWNRPLPIVAPSARATAPSGPFSEAPATPRDAVGERPAVERLG